jgi:hypothetical protein
LRKFEEGKVFKEVGLCICKFCNFQLHERVREIWCFCSCKGIPLPEVMSGLLNFVCRARFKFFSINLFFPAGGVVFLVGAGVSSLEPMLKMKPTHTRRCHRNRLWGSWGMVNCCAEVSFFTCRHWLLQNY